MHSSVMLRLHANAKKPKRRIGEFIKTLQVQQRKTQRADFNTKEVAFVNERENPILNRLKCSRIKLRIYCNACASISISSNLPT